MTRRLITAAGLIIVIASVAAAQERSIFKVGSASAAPGQKSFGSIEVPAGSDEALSIPVAVFHGAKPGPTLALVSRAHGTEYASIIALGRLIGALSPAGISGTVIILPMIHGVLCGRTVPPNNPGQRTTAHN